MGIECREGLASECAGTAERSTVDHTARPNALVLTEPIKVWVGGFVETGVLESSQRTLRFSAMSGWQ
jgi:hypothetical protein